ncbi:MAG TPA: NrfD/PsrC family molybdoenzyme membrane anchor subunit [Chthonomonadaceae bacterium]|nr:NrfD/PsrC family molybdoenzyme membrane anchor subunit [Chthonomonadaceae bacterium]
MSDSTRISRRPALEGSTTWQPAPGERTAHAGKEQPAPTYYDVPMLKPPVWKWEIPSYFFLGGLSAGAFVLSRLAARFGKGRYREVTQAGTAVAAAALAPCPLLLIRDLGDPKRFHFMLRVFKPQSPMNLGAWTLMAYSGAVTLAAMQEWLLGRRKGRARRDSLPARVAGDALSAATDGLGIPVALLLGGYTGVLLSTTSTPLWARNPWLGPLFSASALGAGAEAINLALSAKAPDAAREPVEQVGQAARLAEAVTLGGFLASAGSLAAPLTQGKYAPHLWGGAIGAGLLLPTLLENAPVGSQKTRRWVRIAGAALGLAGGLALRWAITQAGHPSASDPQAARKASRKT